MSQKIDEESVQVLNSPDPVPIEDTQTSKLNNYQAVKL